PGAAYRRLQRRRDHAALRAKSSRSIRDSQTNNLRRSWHSSLWLSTVDCSLPSPKGDMPLPHRVGQRPQQRSPIASPRATVHTRERRRLLLCESFERLARVRRMGEIVERLAERFAGLEDVFLDQRFLAYATLCKQIAAEKGLRRHLHREAAFPAMRHMRRIEPAHSLLAKNDLLAIGQRARLAIREILDRRHRSDTAADRDRIRCRR